MPVPVGALGEIHRRAQEIFASEYPSAKLTLEPILGNQRTFCSAQAGYVNRVCGHPEWLAAGRCSSQLSDDSEGINWHSTIAS